MNSPKPPQDRQSQAYVPTQPQVVQGPVVYAVPVVAAVRTGPTNGLATAALTLGILSVVLSWVPVVGLILALVGIGLAVPAVVRANTVRVGLVPAVWGLCLSGFGTVIFMVIATA